ncbi:MAG: 3-isopropylmalate dehydratase small subunit [Candidatus Fibromonas sp.]|jgi:3-isopropylmalate/(R)-2-methylmalate dehydratase small subunit|nr:3-isopropylmalate dehydratase small subunit [Candidatus Fibromonas sp.]
MRTIEQITGKGLPLRGNDIDTDRIIPARFLKSVTFDGLGEHAFEDDIEEIHKQGGTHPFRDAKYKGAGILVSNRNFGCGSSREHAPQALLRFGIKAIIAESYSEIFFGNCVSIGIPCFTASHETAEEILEWVEKNPATEFTVSVKEAKAAIGGKSFALKLAEGPRGQFLDGSWHARSVLLLNKEKIKSLEKSLPY